MNSASNSKSSQLRLRGITTKKLAVFNTLACTRYNEPLSYTGLLKMKILRVRPINRRLERRSQYYVRTGKRNLSSKTRARGKILK